MYNIENKIKISFANGKINYIYKEHEYEVIFGKPTKGFQKYCMKLKTHR